MSWVRVLRWEYQGDNLLTWVATSALAATTATFHAGWFCVGLVMLTLSQAALELLDGYYDHAQGAHGSKRPGDGSWTGGSGVLAEGSLSPGSVKRAALVCGSLATVLFACVTVARTGVPGLVVGLIGALAGAGWAMPPLKLSYRGVGELVQGVVMGPLMAAQAWMIATGRFEWTALWVGVPFGALELAMGLLNNFIDRDSDARAGKRTWVVRHGARAGAVAHAVALALAFVCHAALVVAGVLPVATLACLLWAPLAFRASRRVFASLRSEDQARSLAVDFPTYGVVTAYGLTLVATAIAWRSGTAVQVSAWLAAGFCVFYAPVLAVLWAKRSRSGIYDFAAPAYNAVSRVLGFERRLREAAGTALGHPERIADVGCGTGFQLQHLPPSVRRVLGVDPSARSLDVAQKIATRRGLTLTALAEDAAEATLPKGELDAAIAVFAMSVIPRWETALTRCVAAVKPGGRIVLLEQERARSGLARLLNPVAALANALLGADNTRAYTPVLEAAGCRVERTEAFGGLYALYVATRGPEPIP